MQRLYSTLAAALIATAAMAQAQHPFSSRLNRLSDRAAATQLLQRTTAPAKATQVFPINTADPVKLYTNEAYSQPGHYDYYFSFANTDDEYYFPMVFFDLYLPTADGLQAGTYTMADGTVDPNLMVMANYNDYIAYYYGYAAYEWSGATITLTEAEGEDMWTVDFSVTTAGGSTYTFNYTGALPVEPDDYDPSAQEPEPEVEYTYKYEPTTATNMDIAFEAPDYTDAFVDEYLVYDILLNSKQKDAAGHNYEARLYLVTTEHQPHADLYPVNSSEATNTFLASRGCPTTTTSGDTPCYLRTYDDNYVYNTWYIVAGQINLFYDADGRMGLEGNVASYNGSTVHFTAGATAPEGIDSVLASGPTMKSGKIMTGGRIIVTDGTSYYNLSGQPATTRR